MDMGNLQDQPGSLVSQMMTVHIVVATVAYSSYRHEGERER